jgi:hypothetical protein
MADPTGAKPRVDTDANEGFAATRAKNLAQTVLEYKERTQFAGQAVQAADPVDALYFPATHAEQVPPAGPENPALQVQLVKAELPTGELEFDGQAEHATDPVNALYFPATHAVQVPPRGPVHPALQVQLVKDALPAGELEFDGQALHVELAEAPTAAEYVPAPQSEHVPIPVNSLYFPATHAEQVPPAGPVDPALQVQLVKAELPTGELEFDGQARHVEAVIGFWYVPAWHLVQDEAPDASAYVPAGQSAHPVVASTLQAASNPAVFKSQLSPSDSNITCINPVDDTYGPVLGLLPDNRATS